MTAGAAPGARDPGMPVKADRKLDAALGEGAGFLAAISSFARQTEAAGYSGLWSSETARDPFLPLLAAADGTSLELGTAIAVAFARTPMSLAYTAHDLQLASGGRFMLGLGSQVRAHIERRFSMPWSEPARRMREYIAALRAIWACWNEGAPLSFHGDFYTHTLMTPFFTPPPSPNGPPKVYLAAVGEKMTEAAAEVCDGLMRPTLHHGTLPARTNATCVAARSHARRQDRRRLLHLAVRPVGLRPHGGGYDAIGGGGQAADRVLRQHAVIPGRPGSARLG